MTTRRGELSVRVDSWELLAPTRRSFPDKWAGLSDVDTRYRQRYLDLVVNQDSASLLKLRSDVIRSVREFLHYRPSQMPLADAHSIGNPNRVKADVLFSFLKDLIDNDVRHLR